MSDYVKINEATCTDCGSCVDLCPQGILYIDEKTGKCKVTDGSKCDRLRGCESLPKQVYKNCLIKLNTPEINPPQNLALHPCPCGYYG